MNHSITSSQTDDYNAILSKLPIFSVFYIDTHGQASGFGGATHPGGSDPDFVNYFSTPGSPGVPDAISSKNGNVNLPPFNFVEIDACNSGGNLPSANGYSGTQFYATAFDHSGSVAFGVDSGADRAFLGWNTEELISEDNAQWVKRVWDNLAAGYTIKDAVRLSSNDGVPEDGGEPGWDTGSAAVGSPVIASSVIYGDRNMKLHGVYSGVDANQWFRQLP